MYPEIEQFKNGLTCQYPTSSTRVHYTSDLVLFFAWAQKLPAEISVQEVDKFIAHCQQKVHAASSINRRLAALNTFYYFLAVTEDHPPAYPVIPRRHFLPKEHPLPRDVHDKEVEAFFAGLENLHDQAIFRLMLNCGLRTCEIRRLRLGEIIRRTAASASSNPKG
jgi:site-specific recombinase XerD